MFGVGIWGYFGVDILGVVRVWKFSYWNSYIRFCFVFVCFCFFGVFRVVDVFFEFGR